MAFGSFPIGWKQGGMNGFAPVPCSGWIRPPPTNTCGGAAVV